METDYCNARRDIMNWTMSRLFTSHVS